VGVDKVPICESRMMCGLSRHGNESLFRGYYYNIHAFVYLYTHMCMCMLYIGACAYLTGGGN
jgi:hypothetical protein